MNNSLIPLRFASGTFVTYLSKNWLRLAMVGGLLAALVFAAVGPAQAVTEDTDGVVAAGEVIDDDLLMSAQTVRMDGTVNGNLIATGQTVTINGKVTGDVIADGAQVFINGPVGGNVIIAGANLEVNGPVSGSVFAAGYSLVMGEGAVVNSNLYSAGFSTELKPGSTIMRDAQVAGYQALLSGTLKRNLNVDTAALELGGAVGGDVNAHVGQPGQNPPPMFIFPPSSGFQPVPIVPAGLRVAASAEIGGELRYASESEQTGGIKAVPAGGIRFEQAAPKANVNVRLSPTQLIYTWFFGQVQ